MTTVPTFHHPYASTIFPVAKAALLVSGRLSTESAQRIGADRRSPGWQLERASPLSHDLRPVYLRWGFAAAIVGPADLDHGHIYVSLHYDTDSVAVLCQCGESRTDGRWLLDVHCSRPNSFLLRDLDVQSSIDPLTESEALRIYIRRMSAFFGSLPEVAATR